MSTAFAVATPLVPPSTVAYAGEAEPVDMARLLEMVDDDAAGLRKLVNLYLTESHHLMGTLHAAVHSGSPTQAEWVAHKLGGSSATCGMIGIVAPLREMERSSREDEGAGNELLLREADRQHGRIRAYLMTYVLKN